MNEEDLSKNEIKKVVKSFKSYLKQVANHSAIDYFRKKREQRIEEISLDELLENVLVIDDEMIFSEILEDFNSIFSNSTYLKAFEKLTEKEQKILSLYSKNYNVLEISNILGISKNNVSVTKTEAIRKFKRIVNEDDGIWTM